MFTIYPSPGSFNEFKDRNPEIVSPDEQLHHLAVELSMWRATSPDIDMRVASLNIGEARYRQDVEGAISRGETVLRLTEWPVVGGYEAPTILDWSFLRDAA